MPASQQIFDMLKATILYSWVHQELSSTASYTCILLAIKLGEFLGKMMVCENTMTWVLLLQCLAVNGGMFWWFKQMKGNNKIWVVPRSNMALGLMMTRKVFFIFNSYMHLFSEGDKD